MTITVKNLQKLLSTYHPDDVVVLSSDGEGNNFSPLGAIEDDHFDPETREMWYVKEGEQPDPWLKPCIVLWPV